MARSFRRVLFGAFACVVAAAGMSGLSAPATAAVGSDGYSSVVATGSPLRYYRLGEASGEDAGSQGVNGTYRAGSTGGALQGLASQGSVAAGAPFGPVDSLPVGTEILNGGFRLAMQTDGNLVLYNSSADPVWASTFVGGPIAAGSSMLLDGSGFTIGPWRYNCAGCAKVDVSTAGYWVMTNTAGLAVYRSDTGNLTVPETYPGAGGLIQTPLLDSDGAGSALPASNAAQTFETWVKVPASSWRTGGILWSSNDAMLRFGDSQNMLQYSVPSTVWSKGESWRINSNFVIPRPISDNAWHHVVLVVYNDSATGLYFDGQYVGDSQQYFYGAKAVTGSRLWVGGVKGVGVDEFALYPRVLSASEVRARFSIGALGAVDKCPPAATDIYGAEVVRDSAVAYWPLNDPAGSRALRDLSGRCENGSYGSVNAASTDVVTGVLGNGLAMTGDDAGLLLGAPTGIRPSVTPQTYELWARFGPGWITGQRVFQHGRTFLELGPTTDRLMFGVNSIYGWSETTTMVLPAGQTFTDGKWHHLVVSQSSDPAVQTKLFVDGIQAGAMHNGVAVATTGGLPVYVGRFKGEVDEIALYTTALTAGQVKKHFDSSSGPVTPTNPVVAAKIVRLANTADGKRLYRVTVTVTKGGAGITYQVAIPTGHIAPADLGSATAASFRKTITTNTAGTVEWVYQLENPRGIYRANLYANGQSTVLSTVEVK